MTEALIALQAAGAMLLVAVFWAVVIFVIPTYLALVVASWFPLTGQWRKRWSQRRGTTRGDRSASSGPTNDDSRQSSARLVLRRPHETEEAEFLRAHRATSPLTPNFIHYYEEGMSFRRYLEVLGEQEQGINLPPRHVPTTFLFAFVGDRIVGRASIRHGLNEWLERNGGHIGYVVVPEFRRRGYATAILAEAVRIAARHLKLPRVLLTVDDSNLGSIKVIEKNGGVFEGMVTGDSDQPKRRYWIQTSAGESSAPPRSAADGTHPESEDHVPLDQAIFGAVRTARVGHDAECRSGAGQGRSRPHLAGAHEALGRRGYS